MILNYKSKPAEPSLFPEIGRLYLVVEEVILSGCGIHTTEEVIYPAVYVGDGRWREVTDYIHVCVCTSSMKIKSSDIFDIFLPAVGHEPEIVHLVGED